jgi:hypothetical protein
MVSNHYSVINAHCVERADWCGGFVVSGTRLSFGADRCGGTIVHGIRLSCEGKCTSRLL